MDEAVSVVTEEEGEEEEEDVVAEAEVAVSGELVVVLVSV